MFSHHCDGRPDGYGYDVLTDALRSIIVKSYDDLRQERFVLQMADICDNVWSICMSQGNTSNGTLTVGGVDDRLHLDDVQ